MHTSGGSLEPKPDKVRSVRTSEMDRYEAPSLIASRLTEIETAINKLSQTALPERPDGCRRTLKYLDAVRVELSCLSESDPALPEWRLRMRRMEHRCRLLRVVYRRHLARLRFVEALPAVQEFDDLEAAVKEFEESLKDIARELDDSDFVRESLFQDAATAASILERERRRILQCRRKAVEILEAERAEFRKQQAVCDIKAARRIYEHEVREWWADAEDLVDALVLVERVERSDVPDILRKQAAKLERRIFRRLWLFLPMGKHVYQSRICLKDYTQFKEYPNWSVDEAADWLWVQEFRRTIMPDSPDPEKGAENPAAWAERPPPECSHDRRISFSCVFPK